VLDQPDPENPTIADDQSRPYKRLSEEELDRVCGDAGGRWLPREWVFLRFSRREPSRGRSGGVGHTDSLDGLPTCGVNR